MADERNGIDDPWQRGPKSVEAPSTSANTPGSDRPPDWDLVPDAWYTLRVPGAYGALTIHGANTMEGAAIIFLSHVENSELLRTTLQQGGFHFCNTKNEVPEGYMLHTPDGSKVLYNPSIACGDVKRRIRNGFSQLVKTLIRTCRQDLTFRTFLKKLGVEPLLS